jgi:hypothetical protein
MPTVPKETVGRFRLPEFPLFLGEKKIESPEYIGPNQWWLVSLVLLLKDSRTGRENLLQN